MWMSGAFILFIAGFVSEVVGLLIVGREFVFTWQDHAQGETFLAPAWNALRQIVLKIRDLAGKLAVWRRPRTKTISATITASLNITGNLRITKSYGPLPSIREQPDEFAELVQSRLAELLDKVQKVEHQLTDEVEAIRSENTSVANHTANRFAEIDNTIRSVAVGDLRVQVVGWFLVLFGMLLQAISTLWTSFNR
jgi:hypothetical protein